MLFSIFQFGITTLLAVVCARAMGLSGNDIPFISLVIPALWILPRGGIAGILLLAAMAAYGMTLSYQPASLSVSVWVLFPLLMVAFSQRSNIGVVACCGLITLTLEVGIMVTQASGKLGGTPMVTMVQILSVAVIWWIARSWRPRQGHSWWALFLVIPLWVADLGYAALLSLTIVGIMASMETIRSTIKDSEFCWHTLLCWTLPSVGFATFVLSPDLDVPNPVFVVWMCLLVTAWMTDYILRSNEEQLE